MVTLRTYQLQVHPADQGWWPWGHMMEVQVIFQGQLIRKTKVWGRTKPHALRAAVRWGRHLARRHHQLHGFSANVTYSLRSPR